MADSSEFEEAGPIDSDESDSNRKILEKMRKCFRLAYDADEENREHAMEDVKFVNVPGEQWEANMKKERGNRPCYEFNKLRISNKRVINNMRANRPAGKVRAVEGGDTDIAEINEGLLRNIWNRSDGDTIIDYAGKYQVDGGMGAWRVVRDYADDDVFEQDLWVEPIPNPFTLWWDPTSVKPLKTDANWWVLSEKISNDTFEEQWPNAEKISWPSNQFDDDEDWDSDEEIRIAEFWWKEPIEKELFLLDDGKVVDSTSEGGQLVAKNSPDRITRRRMVKTHRIMSCIASGSAMLEKPKEWGGKYFPFVVIFGDWILIDGKEFWNGQTRFGKDAQRSYNVSRTAVTETIAQAPQAKWWATVNQSKGQFNSWKNAHVKNLPFLLFNHDPQEPGPPKRSGGADIPIALIQETQLAAEEINMVTGIYQGDVGAPNQATSGRQEIARQNAGHLATFDFEDNMGKGIQLTWKILLDLVPKTYDSERELRILGNDGKENYVTVNTFETDRETGKKVLVRDLTMGKYDVTVTIGPNWTTKRQEAAETYMGLLQGAPQLWALVGDLIFRSLDLPYAEEISERIQATLPPEIQQLIHKDENVEVPPEVQQMMNQANQAMQMVEAGMKDVESQAGELETDKAEVEKLIADLRTDRAQFKAEIAQELAKLYEKQAQMIVERANFEAKQAVEGAAEQGRAAAAGEADQLDEQMEAEMAAGMNAISQMAASFNERVESTLAEIRQVAGSRPKVKSVRSGRDEKGGLVAIPEYEDDQAIGVSLPEQ